MFHFSFSNENKARECLTADQQKRVQHVRAIHVSMKDLNAALNEAVRCHDRYVDALDKVVNALALQSDTLEDAREHLGQCAASILPTHAAAKRLCEGFNAWKVSEELRALRKELDDLKQLTESGRQTTKRNKTTVENLEKYAIRCAAVNTADHTAKIEERKGKAREKLMNERRDLNASLATYDASVSLDIQTTGEWWSKMLVTHCDDVYNAFAHLGRRTVAEFPPPSRSPAASQAPQPQLPPPQQSAPHSCAPPAAAAATPQGHNGSGAPPTLYTNYATGVPVPPPAAGTHPGYGGDANTAAGVPLEFQTSHANAQHTKTLD